MRTATDELLPPATGRLSVYLLDLSVPEMDVFVKSKQNVASRRCGTERCGTMDHAAVAYSLPKVENLRKGREGCGLILSSRVREALRQDQGASPSTSSGQASIRCFAATQDEPSRRLSARLAWAHPELCPERSRRLRPSSGHRIGPCGKEKSLGAIALRLFRCQALASALDSV